LPGVACSPLREPDVCGPVAWVEARQHRRTESAQAALALAGVFEIARSRCRAEVVVGTGQTACRCVPFGPSRRSLHALPSGPRGRGAILADHRGVPPPPYASHFGDAGTL